MNDKDFDEFRRFHDRPRRPENSEMLDSIVTLLFAAESILILSTTIPFGVFVMWRSLNKTEKYFLPKNNSGEPFPEIDFKIINEFYSQIRSFEMHNWLTMQKNRENHAEQYERLDRLTLQYKIKIIDKCFEIVDKLRPWLGEVGRKGLREKSTKFKVSMLY